MSENLELIRALSATIDPELQRRLDRARCLVLNADYRPMSVLSPSVVNWRNAFEQVFSDTVEVVLAYESIFIRSATAKFYAPSVVALKKFKKSKHRVMFSKENVFMRDDWTCQYCGEKLPGSDLTFDHYVPRRHGGKTKWDNILTACSDCNGMKGSRSMPEWRSHPNKGKRPPLGDRAPLKQPRKPDLYELENKARDKDLVICDPRWADFLAWKGRLIVNDVVTGENYIIRGGERHDYTHVPDIPGF